MVLHPYDCDCRDCRPDLYSCDNCGAEIFYVVPSKAVDKQFCNEKCEDSFIKLLQAGAQPFRLAILDPIHRSDRQQDYEEQRYEEYLETIRWIEAEELAYRSEWSE